MESSGQTSWSKSYEHAVVVTAEEQASQVGSKILQQGGNAVDAAIAVQFALAVTLPRAGNIGGGGFMVLHLSDGTNVALDFREQAPLEADADMYLREGEYVPKLSRTGGLASGVPGVVDGMVNAHRKYGSLPFKELVEPAIELAQQGYRLSYKQAQYLNHYAKQFRNYRGSTNYFIPEHNEDWQEGELFQQADLARTLQRIADHGRAGFYEGTTADLLVREIQQQGGIMSHKDLKNYKSVWRNPVKASFMGYDLFIMPPPSSGSIAIAQILEMLKSYELREMGFNSAAYIHLVTETMRRAFADRAHFLGDPDFVDIPQRKLLAPSYNERRMETFNPEKASASDQINQGDIPFPESSETTHYSIIDQKGNAVAVTTTLNGSFGSKVAVSGAGFFLNNEMDDFTAEPGEPNMFGLIQGKANAIEPAKRMLSSMSPTIVTKNDSTRMVLGAAGGPRIITATLHNFLNRAVFNMEPGQAVSAPRFHHQWMPDTLYYEQFGLSADTKKQLKKRGHALGSSDNLGRAHTIFIDEAGLKYGAADPRSDGAAAGF
ncbi:gamma-glutamyltransferase [Fodinibius sediminis]|uniref:gamma-glutamyltransferase n=1 Tax=Fodinibius sediminis TaxID=1214077 RepID=UPI001FE6C680|nr:gamma-glutamyltransferase [Fodinibius sediminis]